MEKLEKILEYEFHVQQEQKCFHDKAKKLIHIKLEDVKDDVDVFEFMNQLKGNIAYNAMRTIDEELYKVKQLLQKENEKLNSECNI